MGIRKTICYKTHRTDFVHITIYIGYFYSDVIIMIVTTFQRHKKIFTGEVNHNNKKTILQCSL